jgi:hypothetical protein
MIDGYIEKKMRICLSVFLFFLNPWIFSGCLSPHFSNTYRSPSFQSLPNPTKILLLPWENVSPYTEGGEIVLDLLKAELEGIPSVVVYTVRDIPQKEQGKPQSSFSLADGIRLSREVGAHYFLTGTIIEMGALRERKGIGERIVFSGTLEIYDSTTGEVVFRYRFSESKGSDLLPRKIPVATLMKEVLSPPLQKLFFTKTISQ